MKQLCVPAFISKLTTLVGDNTLRLTVDCQEMTPEQEGELLRLKRKIGWFFFLEKVQEIDLNELPEIKLEEWEKSPSERLRGVLYWYWKQRNDEKKIQTPFEAWYRDQMERIITQIKEKLDV